MLWLVRWARWAWGRSPLRKAPHCALLNSSCYCGDNKGRIKPHGQEMATKTSAPEPLTISTTSESAEDKIETRKYLPNYNIRI